MQRYRMVRPIYGVDIAADKAPAVFGDFKIDFGSRLLASTKESLLVEIVSKPEHLNQLFIECHVLAKMPEDAYKVADVLFRRFELVFRLLIGRRIDRVAVGVVNYNGAQTREKFVYSSDDQLVGHGSAWHGAIQPFLLCDERFPQPTPALTRLFKLITGKNNDLENHILRCAEWTGEVIAEPNEAAAFVKAAIALEVLFMNQKGVITSSIMAQISESCALLLGNKEWLPTEIERKVKSFYSTRSAVVHSGKDLVDLQELNDFIQLCRHVIFSLLSQPSLGGVDSMEKLANYFRTLKYANAGSRTPPL